MLGEKIYGKFYARFNFVLDLILNFKFIKFINQIGGFVTIFVVFAGWE